MRVTYIGPHNIVQLAGTLQYAERDGDPIEVDDDYGVLLCEQTANWRPSDPESQAVLDEFYLWVAAHEKRETLVDGEIVVRWMPRRTQPDEGATTTTAEPAVVVVDEPTVTTRPRAQRTTSKES